MRETELYHLTLEDSDIVKILKTYAEARFKANGYVYSHTVMDGVQHHPDTLIIGKREEDIVEKEIKDLEEKLKEAAPTAFNPSLHIEYPFTEVFVEGATNMNVNWILDDPGINSMRKNFSMEKFKNELRELLGWEKV